MSPPPRPTMPVIADLPKILRGYRHITKDEFNDGVLKASWYLRMKLSFQSFGIFDESKLLMQQLVAKLEPQFTLGICGTEFQILAEDAVEQMYYEMPEDRRTEAKYRRSDKDFIRNGGAFVRKAKQYLDDRDERRREEARKAKRAEAPKKTINKDQFQEGVRAATLHFATNILVGGKMFDELDRFQSALNGKLEPDFRRGVCGTKFQALAEEAMEKMYSEIPEERRKGTKYVRSEREFIASASAGKTPRKALGLKKTIAKGKAKKAV